VYRDESFDSKPRHRDGSFGGGVLPDEVSVKRSDPAYNAHAYLTKVPIAAIEPFLEAFTERGDVVLDMYGGSGMTGVAAVVQGRRAEVRDISTLGRHIGLNYLNLVDEELFREAAQAVVTAAGDRLGEVYAVPCERCEEIATLSRTVWTCVYECQICEEPVNYYRSFEASQWKKKEMKCESCGAPFSARSSKRIGERPALDTVACRCSPKLCDQEHTAPLSPPSLDGLSCPDVAIAEDRQMFQSSALKKHGLLTTGAFFSERNLAVLAALREAIDDVSDGPIRNKLLFAFTAILSRASKRYQWHPKRPLNAANQNYYIAPVFYEWNVYDLFERKTKAVIRSDGYIRERMSAFGVSGPVKINYELGSADSIDLPDESIDYVFTDPPFGSNIFYSDMNLFQEAWIDDFTDHTHEAVVDRSGGGSERRTTERYERLIADSITEAARVLRTGGWLSIVFSNSSGEMWALLQRSIARAGFSPGEVTLLNKGQRSVKGLASGFENVVTVDLVISMQKTEGDRAVKEPQSPPDEALGVVMRDLLNCDGALTPSHVYLGVIRHYMRQGWSVQDLDIQHVMTALRAAEYEIDAASGLLTRSVSQAA
jgi:16S rRNA G966 N2-methylase RsmD